jgi:hypothetical protein
MRAGTTLESSQQEGVPARFGFLCLDPAGHRNLLAPGPLALRTLHIVK